MSSVRQAQMLTTTPPSPRLQCSFPPYINFLAQLLRHPLGTASPEYMECIISSFPVLYMLYPSSANQSPAKQRIQVVSQPEPSDVTLGSSRMFSIIHGDFLNTLSSLKHGARTIGQLLAPRVCDVPKYQSEDCSNSPPLNSRNILSETAETSESKSLDSKNSKLSPLRFSSSDLQILWDSSQSSLGLQATSPNFLQTSLQNTLQILIPVLFRCLAVADTLT